MKSSKSIESQAISYLNIILNNSEYLEPFLAENDKTPSWDGEIIVHSEPNNNKSSIKGRIPVQVKGTRKALVSKIASYKFKVSDLDNYYKDGGCLIFLVCVNDKTEDYKIYYNDALTYDLFTIKKGIKEDANTKVIQFKEFPNNINEINNILFDFIENRMKQQSFVDKDLFQLKEKMNLQKIKRISFHTSLMGVKPYEVDKYLVGSEQYLYATCGDLETFFPYDKIKISAVTRTIDGKVYIEGNKYYDNYKLYTDEQDVILCLGSCIKLFYGNSTRIKAEFKPSGSLSDCIIDMQCFIELITERNLEINNQKLHINFDENVSTKNLEQKSKYYKDIKTCLDKLGVVEELLVDTITEKGERNLNALVGNIIYGNKINFDDNSFDTIYGPLKIGNLSIWIWAEKKNNKYQISSFFEKHRVVLFAENDLNKKNPYDTTQYVLINKEEIKHISNMNYQLILDDLNSIKMNEYSIHDVNLWMLEILKAYDEKQPKDIELLELAEKVQKLIASQRVEDEDISTINAIQIIKRKGWLSLEEKLKITNLYQSTSKKEIKYACSILLDSNNEAIEILDSMDDKEKDKLLDYPISVFLKKDLEEKVNGKD